MVTMVKMKGSTKGMWSAGTICSVWNSYYDTQYTKCWGMVYADTMTDHATYMIT